ncbi:hypothetical protein [Streptococcus suis]
MMKVAKEFPNWATLPNLSDNALYLIAKELPNRSTLNDLGTSALYLVEQ